MLRMHGVYRAVPCVPWVFFSLVHLDVARRALPPRMAHARPDEAVRVRRAPAQPRGKVIYNII